MQKKLRNMGLLAAVMNRMVKNNNRAIRQRVSAKAIVESRNRLVRIAEEQRRLKYKFYKY